MSLKIGYPIKAVRNTYTELVLAGLIKYKPPMNREKILEILEELYKTAQKEYEQ